MGDRDFNDEETLSEEEEEDEELDETSFKDQKDAILFAIDISTSMLTPPPPSDAKNADQDSPAIAALKCAYYLMQQRIISNPKDMMGILLYGTEQSKFQEEDENSRGGLSYPHCYLLTDLDIPAATDVKTLKTLVEEEEESTDLLTPSKDPVSMANVLFCANQIFTTRAPNFASRRLFIVTDSDNPHRHDKALRSSAAVRAKDLYDLGVLIELFPISKPEREFDRSKFYDDIIYRTSPTDPDAPLWLSSTPKSFLSSSDGLSLLTSLTSEVVSKITPRRALFSNAALELSPNLKISVKGYLLLHRQQPARSCYVWQAGETPEIATLSTTLQADDTARAVEKWEIRKAFKFGGEQVPFTPEEIKDLRNFGDPVIRILGFKPLDSLPFWANLKHSTFIYPSEDDYIGSTRVFSALHQKLLSANKLALVWFIARRNATPVVAAMLPGPPRPENDNDDTATPTPTATPTTPPGLWLIPLPYADDIRSNPESAIPTGPAPDLLIDKMRPIIQQLRLPKSTYDPTKYPNPALQWHWKGKERERNFGI